MNNEKWKRFLTKPFLIAAAVTVVTGLMQLVLNIMRGRGLELINQGTYYVLNAISLTAGIIAVMSVLRKLPKTRYVVRMITILGGFMIVTIWLTIMMWLPYLPLHYATCTNAGYEVAVMRHFMLNDEVAQRLNAASEKYMEEATAAAAEAQAKGETVEEVPNTVTGTELLCSYAAYPIRWKLFYVEDADIEGRVYTLFNATSAVVKIDWPEDNVAHLFVEGAEGEGESTTTLPLK